MLWDMSMFCSKADGFQGGGAGALLEWAGAWMGTLRPLCSVLPGGWLLRLAQTRAQDGGHYSCLASNVAGEARRHFYVEVLGKEGSAAGFLVGFQNFTLAGTVKS